MAFKTNNYEFHPLDDSLKEKNIFSEDFFSKQKKFIFSDDYFFVKSGEVKQIPAETAFSATAKYADGPPDCIISKALALNSKIITAEVIKLLKNNS